MDPARRASPTSTSPWARPPRTSPSPRRSPARSRTSSPPARSSGPPRRSRTGLLGARDHADRDRRRRRQPVTVTKDDGIRAGTTVEKLAELKPVFRPDGTVTAGNACPLNDGAAAVIVMSDTKAKELGLTPLARIVSCGVTGLNPEIMGLGPIEAMPPGPGPRRHDHRRHRPRRDQRGVRRPGRPVGQAPRHPAGTSSTSTAAPSPSATRSA